MDFAFTPEEEAFAAKVRRFLAENPPESFAVDGMDAGYGSGSHSRPFLRALAERGWLALTWPKAHGGQERPMFFKLVLLEELALAGAPFGPRSPAARRPSGRATASRAPAPTCSR